MGALISTTPAKISPAAGYPADNFKARAIPPSGTNLPKQLFHNSYVCYDRTMTAKLRVPNSRYTFAYVLVVIAALAILASAFFLYIDKDTQEASKQLPANSSELAPSTDSSNTSFDAPMFYDQIENGMDFNQLNQLADKTGECASTGVYPPPKTFTCSWTDNDTYFVRVAFDDSGVVSKDLIKNK